MVEPFAWSSGMAMVLIANPLQQLLRNGFVEGADEGFIYFVNWSRNELISKSIDYSLVTYTISQLNHPKTIKSRSPHAPRRSRLMSHLFPIKPMCFWLVVTFLFVFGGHLRPWCIFIPDVFHCSIWWPKQQDNLPPHRDCPVRRLCQPPRWPTAVAVAAVLATPQQSKQRQQQQHDINTTTNMTTNKTANMEGG